MQEKTKSRLKQLLLGTVLSLPLFSCISCSTGHFMDMSLDDPAILPDKAAAIVTTSDGYTTLDKAPTLQTLDKAQRSAKLAKLKRAVQGFNATDTQKIHRTLDLLFAIPDAYVQSRLNDIPTNVFIRPPLPMDGKTDIKTASASYQPDSKSVIVPPESLKQPDLYVMALLGHELDHASKHKMGLSYQQNHLIDNERYVSFTLLDEADACSYEQHLKMCGADYLSKKGRLDNLARAELKAELAQESYCEKYKAAQQKLPTNADAMQVAMHAQGQYIKALLQGGESPKFDMTYQKAVIAGLDRIYGYGERLAKTPNKELTKYVYTQYAQRHGLSMDDLEVPVKWYLKHDNGGLAQTFEPLEQDVAAGKTIESLNKKFKQDNRTIQSTLKRQLSNRQTTVQGQANKALTPNRGGR